MDEKKSIYTKGRGAQVNPHNRFFKNEYVKEHVEGIDDWEDENIKTEYLEVFPKTIVNEVNSPDIGFVYSINPYQGCEHGCVYCYARNTHEYWGYSAGTDFERKIMVKKNAAELLEKTFQKKNWKAKMVMLSGNTDCYQPAERKFEITRQLLEVFLKHKHPVGIITKNNLILRDLDLLKQLNKLNLLRVTLSITSLQEDVRRTMEPRTSSVKNRLQALKTLSENGIAVNVNMAPIIPGINSHEIFDLVKTVADHGAKSVMYIMVRLNGQIGEIFADWVRKNFPERADKVLNQIKATHKGKLNDSRWKTRMKGDGRIAEQIEDIFKIARSKYLPSFERPPLDLELFEQMRNPQLGFGF